MSDHCHYAFFPPGRPAEIIEACPTQPVISDRLGGAYPFPIIPMTGAFSFAVWVRETGAVEGQPRNILASLATLALTGMPWSSLPPLLGPAVITGVAWTIPAPGPIQGKAVGEPIGFDSSIASGFTAMCTDLDLALTGHTSGFSDPRIGGEWAAGIRSMAGRILALPIPDDYPACGRVKGWSREWAALAAAFGDGRQYAPLPLRDL